MPDDFSKKRPQDASKISLSEDWEIRYWCEKFGVTQSQLKQAVGAVGHGAAAVAKYLGK